MRRQSAISTPPLRTYPLQIHPALHPSSANPHIRSEACFVIHTHTHTLFQPIFDPAVHTHPAHLPLPASTSEALASPPSTHSPSFSSRRASRNLEKLASIMPMTKRAAGVSWLWPSSRPCFEHNFSERACALSRNSVGPARTFEESKSGRKLANRKLVHALKRPRREAQKKAQTTNHDHRKSTKKKHKKEHKLQITTTKKSTKKAQTTNHDHKKGTKKAKTTNHDHKKSTKKNQKKHKKAQKSTNYQSRPQKESTNKTRKKNTNYQSRPQKKHKQNTQKNTNYQSRPQKKQKKHKNKQTLSRPQKKHKKNKKKKKTQTTNHDCTRPNFRRCNLQGKLLSKYG